MSGANKAWVWIKEVEVKGKSLDIQFKANPTGPAIKGLEIQQL